MSTSQTVGFQWTLVIGMADEPGPASWLRDVGVRLDVIRKLPPNWDNEGAEPINDRILDVASELLRPLRWSGVPVPRIAPVRGGGIQFEWRVYGRELEVEILPDGSVEYLRVDESGGAEEDCLPYAPGAEVQGLVRWLLEGRC